MGLFSGFGKLLTYPLRRPATEVKTSLKGVKEAMEGAKEIRQKKISDAKAASAYLQGKTAREKFDSIYSLNGWTEEELSLQATAARNTRLGMVGVAAVGLVLMLVMMARVPVWMVAVIGPITVIFCAVCVAMAARYAWWTDQLATRTIYPFADFMARKDFFARVFLP